jgi:8-oxo-dGTP pyrophosphatase MutT (NUDIX family)
MNYDDIQSPFYRVSLKAIIFDDQQRLLVVGINNGTWEMPGGGWEFDETVQECLNREFLEELGVELESVEPASSLFYAGKNKRGYRSLKLAVKATIRNNNFVFGEDVVEAKYVTQQELLALNMDDDEAGIKQFIDCIWP